MCQSPTFIEENMPGGEKPFGSASATSNASWDHSEIPMLLKTFEHLARGSILNWLKAESAAVG
jgi:hypothetical protein